MRWRIRSEREALDRRPFAQVFDQEVELPGGRVVDGYLRIALADFVVVVPVMDSGEIVVLHQYKHGAARTGLTFPGGLIDAGEAPEETARRELLEEAGLAADRLQPLGSYVANGNYGCGRAHLFKATGCRFAARPRSADLEDMHALRMTPDALRAAVAHGELLSLPHVAAFGVAGL